jgi:hypothetical protein
MRSSLLREQHLLPAVQGCRHSFVEGGWYQHEGPYFQPRVHLCGPPGRHIVLCACRGYAGLQFGCDGHGPPCAPQLSCQTGTAFEVQYHRGRMWGQGEILLQAWTWGSTGEMEWGLQKNVMVMVMVMGGQDRKC